MFNQVQQELSPLLAGAKSFLVWGLAGLAGLAIIFFTIRGVIEQDPEKKRYYFKTMGMTVVLILVAELLINIVIPFFTDMF